MCDSTKFMAAPAHPYDLADAFTQLPVGVAIFDTSDGFCCLHHNPLFLAMIGAIWRERGLPAGVPLRDLLSSESYAQIRVIFERARAEGAPFSSDDYVVVMAQETEPRSYQWSLTPLRGPDGGVRALLASGVEITARKAYEVEAQAAARRANEERALLDTLINTAPIGVAFLDREMRFVRINDRLAQLNGMPVSAHLNRRVHEILPALAAAIEPVIQQVIATGRPVMDIEAVLPSYMQRGGAWLKSFYPVLDATGEILGVGVLVTDISDERRMQEELRAITERERERLAEVEQALSIRDTFFSIAAHELKTPLTTLLGQVQLIERRAAKSDTLSERDRRAVHVVVSHAVRLNKLIDAMLDITRIERGYLSLECSPVDLAASTRQVIDEIQPIHPMHDFRWQLSDTPLMISGDAVRLEQVLYNLIENAVKYSPQGGEVEICVERQGDLAQLAVRDQGIGISATAIPHLFECFYRAEGASRQYIAGMGIGLYVVYEIVRLHGGEVRVASVEGEGSCFTVTLPLLAG
ncbi:PAS domain-containing sensor histidine kinase [Chloroflexales bacterium ZM16-3]|nr:PAS domain-containing sensor histidine kinase [Chloroflexales bacterium ZM16-3]